jgi:hypothetical protein
MLVAVITVVSGLARTGTSLMLQMLKAGGLPVLTDGQRVPDEHNVRGYYEWEPVHLLAREPERIDEAGGKAVKVISSLLTALPDGRDYRILLMQRPLGEVVPSQLESMRGQGTPDELAATLQSHIDNVCQWLQRRPHISILTIEYHSLLRDPSAGAARVCDFLGAGLDCPAMAAQVDRTLWRRRLPGVTL